VPDLRCPGLAVRVAPNGSKTWDLAYRVRGAGIVRRLSLGPFPAVSLDAARERASLLTLAAKAGRDLLAEEQAARVRADARITVSALVEFYLNRSVRGKLRTADEMEKRLKRATASISDRPADEIKRRDIRVIVDEVADRGANREANKQKQLIGSLFRWGLGQDIVTVDPTAGLASYGSSVRRERVLSNEELGVWWEWLKISGFPLDYCEALRLQLATGARIGEVAGIRAEEIDVGRWLWTLPAARSKNNRPRVTPLVGIAQNIVAKRLTEHRQGPLGSMIVKRRPQIPIAHFTSHDFRRTVATQLAEMGVALDLVAAVIGHDAGGKAVRTLVRHYIRTDQIEQKKAVLSAWDARLQQIIAGKAEGQNVLPFVRDISL
jgi:integrase